MDGGQTGSSTAPSTAPSAADGGGLGATHEGVAGSDRGDGEIKRNHGGQGEMVGDDKEWGNKINPARVESKEGTKNRNSVEGGRGSGGEQGEILSTSTATKGGGWGMSRDTSAANTQSSGWGMTRAAAAAGTSGVGWGIARNTAAVDTKGSGWGMTRGTAVAGTKENGCGMAGDTAAVDTKGGGRGITRDTAAAGTKESGRGMTRDTAAAGTKGSGRGTTRDTAAVDTKGDGWGMTRGTAAVDTKGGGWGTARDTAAVNTKGGGWGMTRETAAADTKGGGWGMTRDTAAAGTKGGWGMTQDTVSLGRRQSGGSEGQSNGRGPDSDGTRHVNGGQGDGRGWGNKVVRGDGGGGGKRTGSERHQSERSEGQDNGNDPRNRYANGGQNDDRKRGNKGGLGDDRSNRQERNLISTGGHRGDDGGWGGGRGRGDGRTDNGGQGNSRGLGDREYDGRGRSETGGRSQRDHVHPNRSRGKEHSSKIHLTGEKYNKRGHSVYDIGGGPQREREVAPDRSRSKDDRSRSGSRWEERHRPHQERSLHLRTRSENRSSSPRYDRRRDERGRNFDKDEEQRELIYWREKKASQDQNLLRDNARKGERAYRVDNGEERRMFEGRGEGDRNRNKSNNQDSRRVETSIYNSRGEQRRSREKISKEGDGFNRFGFQNEVDRQGREHGREYQDRNRDHVLEESHNFSGHRSYDGKDRQDRDRHRNHDPEGAMGERSSVKEVGGRRLSLIPRQLEEIDRSLGRRIRGEGYSGVNGCTMEPPLQKKYSRQTWEGWAEFWSDKERRPYWENPNLPKGFKNKMWEPPRGWPHLELGPPRAHPDSNGRPDCMTLPHQLQHDSNLGGSEQFFHQQVGTQGQIKNELPQGWIESVEPSSGELYYINQTAGISQWDRPQQVPQALALSHQLSNYGLPRNSNSSSEEDYHQPQQIPSGSVIPFSPPNPVSNYGDTHESSVSDSKDRSNSHAEPTGSSATAVEGVAGVGRSFLTDLARRHSKWLWGGLAEVLHNAVDAGAGTIEIERFPEPDTNPEHRDFGLRIDDDGNGITFDEACTMMQIASDQNFKAKEGQVGGYGVGFKVGSMAMAQTAIVLSVSLKDEETGTTVVGLLSNEPFEERGEFPLGLRRPNTEIIALYTKNGRCYDKKGCTESDRVELHHKIERLNSTIDRDWITTWAGGRKARPGTTIILCGVRHMFRSNDLGQQTKLHSPPRIRIDFERPDHEHDMILCEYDELRNESVQFRHHPTGRRIVGHAARMDYSFRAFCEIMFLTKEATKNLTIKLFGKLIERVTYEKLLRNQMLKQIPDGKNTIQCLLGQHSFPNESNLYGAMLYCEGTLITAYARPHNLEFRPARGGRDEEEHFSAILVVNLLKKDGFAPTPEKLEFIFSDPQKERFWLAIKGAIEDYADTQASVRDENFPLRPLFLDCIRDLKVRLRDYGGASSEEGPLRGVLYTPGREYTTAEHETYHACIRFPISLQDVELKAKAEGAVISKYSGDIESKIRAFKKDIFRVFMKSIKWETEGRFIPDTEGELDINDCTLDDIEKARSKPFITARSGRGAFTIKDIFEELSIPAEFANSTVEQNKEGYPSINDWETVLDYGTTILIPHRRSVAAVVFAKKLLEAMKERVDGFVDSLSKRKRAREEGTVDDMVQCSTCGNWRKFPGAVLKYANVTDFKCEMEARSCDEPDDYRRDTDIDLPQHGSDTTANVKATAITKRPRQPPSDSESLQQGKRKKLSVELFLKARSKSKTPSPKRVTRSNVSGIQLPDPKLSNSESIEESSDSSSNEDSELANKFGRHVNECAEALKKKNNEQMIKSADMMIELW
eukprot:CAMPEP_0194269912 /NCGR_PEP_ID=MMETSP0169-20130528/4005_1 /TAXON_ID=218684 /ORGANISM="Corethron pennatum, Strain L29A3" /LENGTH=1821 /DNA_ID=CAMNT_0039011759 /DNA_START=204 /DNA_END=5666 /DNA_ORIENTATION=+